MKEKVSISITKSLLELISIYAKNHKVNRSEIIEMALENFFSSQIPKKAYILMKKGHLWFLDYKFKNKKIIEYHQEFLENANIKERYIITNDKSFSKEGFKTIYDEGSGRHQALKVISEKTDEPIIVLNGDTIHTYDLNKHIAFFGYNKAPVCVGVMSKPNAINFNKIILTGIQIEKIGKDLNTDIVDIGVYIINPQVFNFVKDDISYVDFYEILSAKGKLIAYFTQDLALNIEEIVK